jgi:hypothetical protein
MTSGEVPPEDHFCVPRAGGSGPLSALQKLEQP